PGRFDTSSMGPTRATPSGTSPPSPETRNLEDALSGTHLVSVFGLPGPPGNRLEKGVTLLRQNAAQDGRAAERRPPRHLVGADVDLPPTQALQKGDGRPVDHPGNAGPLDGRLTHRTRFRRRVQHQGVPVHLGLVRSQAIDHVNFAVKGWTRCGAVVALR